MRRNRPSRPASLQQCRRVLRCRNTMRRPPRVTLRLRQREDRAYTSPDLAQHIQHRKCPGKSLCAGKWSTGAQGCMHRKCRAQVVSLHLPECTRQPVWNPLPVWSLRRWRQWPSSRHRHPPSGWRCRLRRRLPSRHKPPVERWSHKALRRLPRLVPVWLNRLRIHLVMDIEAVTPGILLRVTGDATGLHPPVIRTPGCLPRLQLPAAPMDRPGNESMCANRWCSA